ncbi:MAG: hypothetical protein QNK31_00330 [Porticoccus sp.]|nr:hypothetical protein [Porticoccus sp.]
MSWKIGDGTLIELVGHVNSEGELYGVALDEQYMGGAAPASPYSNELYGVVEPARGSLSALKYICTSVAGAGAGASDAAALKYICTSVAGASDAAALKYICTSVAGASDAAALKYICTSVSNAGPSMGPSDRVGVIAGSDADPDSHY